MNHISMPMWQNGSKILLFEVLQLLNVPHHVNWLLRDIFAVGGDVLGKSIIELENAVKSSDGGVSISRDDLILLSKKIKDLDRIELTGHLDKSIVAKLMCFDSSAWILDYDPQVIGIKGGAWEG